MLVLTRRVGERIVIPGLGVEITLLTSRDGQARIGVSAPGHAVYREELLCRFQPKNGPAKSKNGDRQL